MSNRAIQTLKALQKAKALDNDGLAAFLGVPRPTLAGWLYFGKIPRAATVADLDRRELVPAANWYLPEDRQIEA